MKVCPWKTISELYSDGRQRCFFGPCDGEKCSFYVDDPDAPSFCQKGEKAQRINDSIERIN